jgi:hypothetical protein
MSRYQMVECDECAATARVEEAVGEGWVEMAEEGEGSAPDMRDLCPSCARELVDAREPA